MVKLTFYIYREIDRALNDLEFELRMNNKLNKKTKKKIIKHFTERATFQIKDYIEKENIYE